MRTAGLPTFTKLYGRNDNDELVQGRYEITIDLSECLTIIGSCNWFSHAVFVRFRLPG
jgi:hypothetical protein